MSEWQYIEKDGNPKNKGYYLVAIEQYVSFSDRIEDDRENRIKTYGEAQRGICCWDGKEWMKQECQSFNIDDSCAICKSDHIYAWADVILSPPKMIYPSRKINIDPADYHLTEGQLINFLKSYKRSFEEGYTE